MVEVVVDVGKGFRGFMFFLPRIDSEDVERGCIERGV